MIVNTYNTVSILSLYCFTCIHIYIYTYIHTVPETNSWHLKMDGGNISFLLGPGLFSGVLAVSFRECDFQKKIGDSHQPNSVGIYTYIYICIPN